MNVRAPRKGESVELVLAELDERGRAYGELDGRTVRVRGGVPGARVRAQVHRRRRGEIEAAIEEVLEPGADAVAPRCPHFASCGGCSFQNVAYTAQLAALARTLARTLAPLVARFPDLAVAPPLGCEPPWNYRNKMDFTFGNRRWIEPGEPEGVEADFALGLHVPGRFDKVLDVRSCDIAFPQAAPIVNTARALARAQGLSAWDVRAHEGLLRHLLLRRSEASGELLAALFTTERAAAAVDPFVAALLEAHPEITTCVQRVRAGSALVAAGGEEHLHRGEGSFLETLGGLAYRVSTDTFFQTNTPQAERLLEVVLEEAGTPAEGDVVHDLYCGCGPWALSLARRAPEAEVFGFELVESAVEDARANAERNGITNATFVSGDLAATLSPSVLAERRLPAPDLAVVDPPRAGLHERVVRALAELRPRRVVYVSCNPRSATRDLLLLADGGYRVTRARPVDLFPHTPHLECVFTAELGGSRLASPVGAR